MSLHSHKYSVILSSSFVCLLSIIRIILLRDRASNVSWDVLGRGRDDVNFRSVESRSIVCAAAAVFASAVEQSISEPESESDMVSISRMS